MNYYQLKLEFPTIISLIIAAMIMSDNRLSDLYVLAVERDFNINFEKLMDNFVDLHKNSRILLK